MYSIYHFSLALPPMALDRLLHPFIVSHRKLPLQAEISIEREGGDGAVGRYNRAVQKGQSFYGIQQN